MYNIYIIIVNLCILDLHIINNSLVNIGILAKVICAIYIKLSMGLYL
jgi:hypothetical protein